MEKVTKTTPIKNMKVEEPKEVPMEDDEDQDIYEDDDLEDVNNQDPIIPDAPQVNLNKEQVELQFELKLRRLAEIETQMITKKIALKNPDSLTGVYSEQEMISLAQTLKFEVQSLINYMKLNFKYKDEFFVNKFTEVEKGIKSYEYWVVPDKRR